MDGVHGSKFSSILAPPPFPSISSCPVLSPFFFFFLCFPRTHTTQGISQSQSCDIHEHIHHDDMVSFKFDIADT